MALPDQEPSQEPGALWWRPTHVAALVTEDNMLFLNGYRVNRVDVSQMPAIRFCLGVHTGAARKPFQISQVPGSSKAVHEAVQLLKKFGGIEPAPADNNK